jgi:hypothetical protein
MFGASGNFPVRIATLPEWGPEMYVFTPEVLQLTRNQAASLSLTYNSEVIAGML